MTIQFFANKRPLFAVAFLLLLLASTSLGAVIRSRRDTPVSALQEDAPTVLPAAPAVSARDIVTVLPLDSIPSIDEPQFEAVTAVADDMDADERVIGLVINGEARAYPTNILSSHEIVNDEVGGEVVAVTWCPLCYTALVFSRNSMSLS